ncbi:MAG TPA: hypothetical protein VL284_07625 [Thermoanaerobaculia bacterium]|nr:hypothetical protein [Thermoanaerobaculia bacterium]
MASPGEYPTLPACAALSSVEVRDARSDAAIGKRFVEGKDSPSAAVTTASDVAAWVRTGALDALRRSGAATTKSGAPGLRISVDDMNTSENVLHRSGYEGRITITAELMGANGRSCWRERFDGAAENYGYSGSVENYQETLNHALDRAMIRLLSSTSFKSAVCSC